jgi:hypothetical protein
MNKGLKIRLIPKFTISVLILLVLVTGTTYSILDLDLKYGYAQGNGGKQDLFFISSQDSQCPQNLAEGPSFIDENGCSQPCPTDPEVIPPEVCIPPIEQDQPQDDQPPAAAELAQDRPQDDRPQDDRPQDDQPQDDQPQDDQPQDDQPQDDQQPEESFIDDGQGEQLEQQPASEEPDVSNETMANTNISDSLIGFRATDNLIDSLKPKPYPLPTKPSQCSEDISGKWRGNDGGRFYISQIGTKIWWFGSNTLKEGEGFSNIFNGDRNGLKVTGQWQDVPMGVTRGSGTMILDIDPSGTKIIKASASGDIFGGSEWTKIDTRDPQCIGVLPGSKTGSGGGFIQMFPNSPPA